MSKPSKTTLLSTLEPLAGDVFHARAELERKDTGYTRRNYVRTVFAMGEGTIWIVKQELATRDSARTKRAFSPGEMELLLDQSFDLRENGKVHQKRKDLKLIANLQFAYSCLTRVSGPRPGTVPLEDVIADIRAAIEVRHRITHPKKAAEFDVTDRDICAVRKADGFFQSMGLAALKALEGWPPPLRSQL